MCKNVTLVSGFYPIRSKFSGTQYIEWAKTFMRLESPLVFFTTAECAPLFRQLRGDKPMHLIEIPFALLDVWILYEAHWRKHHTKDPEKGHHSPELYALWAQKVFFVKRAIAENPFNTAFFYWCDVGAFRDPNIPAEILQTFPQAEKLPQDQILLNSVAPMHPLDARFFGDHLCGTYFMTLNRIVGGLWGGGREGCLRWVSAFEHMLVRFFANDRFAGKDQAVMLMAHLMDPTLVVILEGTGDNKWFCQQRLLSALESSPLRIDSTYTYTFQRPYVLGKIQGGLGNQMFQVATAYAYAKRYLGKLAFLRDKMQADGRPLYWDSILHRFQHHVSSSFNANLLVWREDQPTKYKKIIPLDEIKAHDGVFIDGYVQSSKYFEDANTRQEIRMLFRPSATALLDVRSRYGDLLGLRDRVVVVHARRTDYLKSQHNIDFHGPLTAEYYRKALEHIQSVVPNPVFLLCSDDPTYWTTILSEVPALLTHPFHILDESSEVATLTLLQQFSHFVLANSTFSWWAAWLSESPRCVIAPAKWFGPAGPQHYEDIYEPEWIRM